MKEYSTSLGDHDSPEQWAYSNVSKYTYFYENQLAPIRSRDTINFLTRIGNCCHEFHLILAELVKEQDERSKTSSIS